MTRYIVVEGDQQQPNRRRGDRDYDRRRVGGGFWGVVVFVLMLAGIGVYLAVGG